MNSFALIRITGVDMACMSGLLIALIITFAQISYYRRKREALFWLALANLASSIGFVELFLFKSGLIIHLPHFYRVGYIFFLVYMPFSYLYLRSVMLGTFPSRHDLLHALPVVIFLVDHLAFFTRSASQKLSIFDGSQYADAAINFSQGTFLTSGFYVFLITFICFLYWLAQVIVLIKYGKHNKGFFAIFNSPWVKWLFFYLVAQFVIIFPMFIIFLAGDYDYLLAVSTVFSIMSAIFIGCALFIHPDTMPGDDFEAFAFPKQGREYREFNWAINEVESVSGQENKERRQKKNPKNLTEEQISNIRIEIEYLLEVHEPFLKHGYSLQDLSNSLSRPLYQVSAIINQVYGSNFNEFINKYRINYAIKMIREKQFQHLNIYGLADRCGFNNRNSFTAAFKKVTGLTPSEYFKDQG